MEERSEGRKEREREREREKHWSHLALFKWPLWYSRNAKSTFVCVSVRITVILLLNQSQPQ